MHIIISWPSGDSQVQSPASTGQVLSCDPWSQETSETQASGWGRGNLKIPHPATKVKGPLVLLKIIEAIRQMGGEETILKLAGYILTAEKKPA